MIELTLATLVVMLGTWAFVDIYLYHALFDRVRHWGKAWEQSPDRWKSLFGYGLNCPYCLGHWVAAGLVLSLLLFPTSLGGHLTLLDALLVVVIAARAAAMLRENVLRPISADLDRLSEPERRDSLPIAVAKILSDDPIIVAEIRLDPATDQYVISNWGCCDNDAEALETAVDLVERRSVSFLEIERKLSETGVFQYVHEEESLQFSVLILKPHAPRIEVPIGGES